MGDPTSSETQSTLFYLNKSQLYSYTLHQHIPSTMSGYDSYYSQGYQNQNQNQYSNNNQPRTTRTIAPLMLRLTLNKTNTAPATRTTTPAPNPHPPRAKKPTEA